MTVQTSGSSHLCFEGKPWSRHDSLQFKGKEQTKRCVNSLRRGSKRTGLVTFFFLFLHEEESSIQMQHGIQSLRRVSSEYSSCLSQFSSDHSSNLCFQMALQNTRKNVFFSSYTAFPLRFTNNKKWCVQSVMPKLQWTNK